MDCWWCYPWRETVDQVRCVMEESLDKNGKDWLLNIVEVEAELGKVKDSISYQITVRGHSR